MEVLPGKNDKHTGQELHPGLYVDGGDKRMLYFACLNSIKGSKLANIKAVIFDMGGVLLRTEDPTPRTEAGKPYNMNALQLAEFIFGSEAGLRASLGQINDEELYQEVGRHLKLSGNKLERFVTLFWQGDRLDEDLANFVRSLRPRYKTGLLSNAWPGARKALTDRYPCIDAFDVSVISAEVGLMKPFPEIYLLTLQKLGVQPDDAIFIDDMPVNVEAAQALGIHGIQFTTSPDVVEQIEEMLQIGK